MQIRSLSQEDPLQKEMATYGSLLAWKIPWTEEPGGLVCEVAVEHNWVTENTDTIFYLHFNISHVSMWIQFIFLKLCLNLFFSWRIIALQCCVGFCHVTTQIRHGSVQLSSVTQLCPTLCDSMNCSMPGLPVHHQLLEFTQTQVHRVSDAIQPSHPLSSPSPPIPDSSQHQSLFQWVNSSHEVAKVREFQL